MFERRSELEKLVAVAEAGKIVAAAHRRALTQPALTRAIARLESRIGGTLAGRGGRIRATADALWMQAVMAEAVGRFRERFPEVELRLRGAGRAEGLCLLDAGDSDLHCGAMDDLKRLPDHLRREPLPAMTLAVVADRNHPLQAGGATAAALADWPWIDFIADLGPEADSPSLNDLLDRLHARTGRRVASIVRAGAAGLALMASGPYLAWLPMEMLVRLPGRPLCSLPLEFGRRRCPTGLVLRRSAESLAPVRGLRDLIRETANRGARLNPPQRAALPCLDFMSDQLFDGRRIRIPTIVDAFPSSVSKTGRHGSAARCGPKTFRSCRRQRGGRNDRDCRVDASTGTNPAPAP